MNHHFAQHHDQRSPQPSSGLHHQHSRLLTEPSPAQNHSHLPSINPEECQKQKLYKNIVDLNRNYLTEKVVVSEVKKPSKYEYKLPSKTGISQYHRRYGTGKRSYTLADSVPVADKSGSKLKGSSIQVTNLQSSYRADFSQKKKPNQAPGYSLNDISKKNIVLISDKLPTFNQSAYNRDYQFRGFIQSEAAKQTDSVVSGGKFQGESTYQSNFRMKNYLKSLPTEPVLQKQHKIFVGISNQNQSSYQQTFMKKQSEIESSFKPDHKYLPHTQKVVRKSEYQNQFFGKDPQKVAPFSYMNGEELDKYVMTSLD